MKTFQHHLLRETLPEQSLAGGRLRQLLPTYFKFYERLAPNSQRALVNSWNRFCTAAGVETLGDLQALTTEDVEEVQEQLRESNAMSTARHTLTIAKQMWRYLKRVGMVEENPFEQAERFRGKNNVPHQNVLFPGELEKMEAALQLGTLERALVTVLARQGWREHVLMSLTMKQLHYDGLRWTAVFLTKGNKQRTQVVDRRAMEAVKAWRERLGRLVPLSPDTSAFVPSVRGFLSASTIYKKVTQTTRRVLGRVVTPHGLRATFISAAIAKHGLEAARQLAGHENIATTQRYSRWVVVDAEKGMQT